MHSIKVKVGSVIFALNIEFDVDFGVNQRVWLFSNHDFKCTRRQVDTEQIILLLDSTWNNIHNIIQILKLNQVNDDTTCTFSN